MDELLKSPLLTRLVVPVEEFSSSESGPTDKHDVKKFGRYNAADLRSVLTLRDTPRPGKAQRG